MTLLTLLAVLTAAAVVAGLLLLRPWLVRHVDAGQARRAANVTAYRSRLVEIEAEQAAGSLDAEAAEALRAEAGARLLQDTRGETPADATPDRRRVGVGIALALLPILLAGAWYVHNGSWRAAELISSGETQTAAPSKAETEKLVDQLAAHMKAHPADPQGGRCSAAVCSA
jgi:cytochrome c-type biogenesis protein CcmI